MISIEQLRILQSKVSMLVQKYRTIVDENALLKKKAREYEQRIAELEAHYSAIQEDQGEMERTLLATLDELNKIEEHVTRDSPIRVEQGAEAHSLENLDM